MPSAFDLAQASENAMSEAWTSVRVRGFDRLSLNGFFIRTVG